MKDVIDFEKAKNEKGYHDLEATIDRLRNNIRDLLSMNTQYKTELADQIVKINNCLLYTSPSPRDGLLSRMPSSA